MVLRGRLTEPFRRHVHCKRHDYTAYGVYVCYAASKRWQQDAFGERPNLINIAIYMQCRLIDLVPKPISIAF